MFAPNSGNNQIHADTYFSLSFSATTPHGRLSKFETAKSKKAPRRRGHLARRPIFEEVQVDKKTSFIQFSTRILRLPLEGVAHSSCLERTRSTQSFEE